MYGLIGSFVAKTGQRDALVAILTAEVGPMPGCRSYIVATDPADADLVWITEVWDDKAAHEASLAIPAVKAAIVKAMPLIERFGESRSITPVGGIGL